MNKPRALAIGVVFHLLLLMPASLALGQFADVTTAGIVEFVMGSVTVTSSAGAKADVGEGSTIRAGDTIETAPSSEVHVQLEDGGYLAVRPGTIVQINSFQAKGKKDDGITMTLMQGAFRSVSGWIRRLHPRGYKIVAPNATIGIRGTDHETFHILAATAAPDEIPGTHERVHSGATFIEHNGKVLEIAEGRAGYAGLNGKLELHEKVPPYLARHRTGNEQRIERHSREIERHIEEKLRAGGHLKHNETARDFFRRHEQKSRSNTKMRPPETHPRPRQ